MYGGIIGGVLSGVVIAVGVFIDIHPSIAFCLKIIPCCALLGWLFGGLIYIGRTLLVQLNIINTLWANFFGCLVACIVAGTLSGMLAMWLFGDAPYEVLKYQKIVIASIVAALSLIFGTLAYDYEGKLKYVAFSLVVALVLSAFISTLGFLLIYNSQIATYLDIREHSQNLGDLIASGAVLGLINGFVFGLVIGFTVVFYKYWQFAEKQEAAFTRH